MSKPEYFQHLYIILGRARKLEWLLIRNFPMDEDGEPDWKVFESGPPAYLCEFMDVLEKRAKETYPRLIQAQQKLGMPDWENAPTCLPDPDHKDRFLYVAHDWIRSRQRVAKRFVASPAQPTAFREQKKRRTSVLESSAAPSSATIPVAQQVASVVRNTQAPVVDISPFMRACGHLEPSGQLPHRASGSIAKRQRRIPL
jgi:hypothetical protein